LDVSGLFIPTIDKASKGLEKTSNPFPMTINELKCASCKDIIIKQDKMVIKEAPSENWKDVIELWKCHDEDFD